MPSFDSLAEPVTLLRELLLTGYYPVATWLPYLLVGMVLGRLDLRSAATATRVGGRRAGRGRRGVGRVRRLPRAARVSGAT